MAIEAIDCEEVPGFVKELCSALQRAGHSAYIVGGAVRDLLLGRPVADWDVTTSALPAQVQALFRKTIPTGIAHGTVTVLMPHSGPRIPVEVTTYRGDGAYSDGRRPDSVEFVEDLVQDLQRRDFTINAIALDPVACKLEDPLDGMSDLEGRVVRAVGAAEERFDEDGLRPMRAVRFATVLEFTVHQDTLSAIPATLSRFRQVSAERIQVEVLKLLRARRPSIGLSLMHEGGLLREVFHQLPRLEDAQRGQLAALIDDLPQDPMLRIAAMVRAVISPTRQGRPSACRVIAGRLKLSNRDGNYLERASLAADVPPDAKASAAVFRRSLRALGPDLLDAQFALWEAEGSLAVSQRSGLRERYAQVLAEPPLLSVRDLAVGGRELMSALEKPPGPWLGELLDGLLEETTDDPALNTAERLLSRAKELVAEREG